MKSIKIILAAAAFAIVSSTASAGNGLSGSMNVDLGQVEVNAAMNADLQRELTKRFVEADTTLTPAEIAQAYYGHAFTFDYDPRPDYSSIRELIIGCDYATAFNEAMQALQLDPFSLELTVDAYISAVKMRDADYIKAVTNLQRRYDMLINTILASGKGIGPETPFKVIRTGDILTFLRDVIGVGNIVGTSMIGPIDAYKVTFPGYDREHILYFDNTCQHRFEASNP